MREVGFVGLASCEGKSEGKRGFTVLSGIESTSLIFFWSEWSLAVELGVFKLFRLLRTSFCIESNLLSVVSGSAPSNDERATRRQGWVNGRLMTRRTNRQGIGETKVDVEDTILFLVNCEKLKSSRTVKVELVPGNTELYPCICPLESRE